MNKSGHEKRERLFPSWIMQVMISVSIGYYKQGLFRGNAGEYIGRLTNVDIGIKLIDENGEEYQ